jgi:hypothetical protein
MDPIDFRKFHDDARQAFGWARIITKGGVLQFDDEDQAVSPEAMESAVYEYVMKSRIGTDIHVVAASTLIESYYFSKAKQDMMGIDLGFEGWWVGYQFVNDAVWEEVRKGQRPMFSIGGKAFEKVAA